MLYDIAVIGAGPSGIMAAIAVARLGKTVLLLEKNPAIGRKILATGNGRCNITNKNAEVANYHGANSKFIEHVLDNFDQFKSMKFFEDLGLVLKEEDRGRMFPRTNQAKSVVDILESELIKLNVKTQLNTEIKSINKSEHWTIQSASGQIFESSKLILTTGGVAAHQFGSSGDGIFWSLKLGHKIEDTYAALVPVEVSQSWVKNIQGIKVEAKASFYADAKLVSEIIGDLIFTHYGLSGPAIMSQARNIAPLCGNNPEIHIDFIPEMTEKDLDELIKNIFDSQGAKTIKNALVGLIPINLVPIILEQSNINVEIKCANVSRQKRADIVKNLKGLKFSVTKLRPYKEAQVTRGGIDVTEVSPSLESLQIKSLYFAGEILDVDGDSGGFNLQWAWSSGHLAGTSASNNS